MSNWTIPVVELGDRGYKILIDLNLYTTEAIIATCYKYTDIFYIYQQKKEDNAVEIVFEAINDEVKVSTDVVKRFCNDLIDQQLRVITNQRFGYIRDLIVREAFKPVNK